MRAQQVVELGKPYELRDVEVPKPGKGELLLRSKASGLCHTDGMVRCDGFGGAKLPLTGSHEPSGIVEAVGEGVTRFKRGDRVGAVGTMADGQCADCKAGRRVFCDNADFVGLGKHGAFADFVVVSAASAFPVPDELEFSQVAPITCAGLTIYNAIQRADLPKGGLLAISGLGALGHFGVAIAKVLGLRVVGVDVKKDALELARGLKFAPDLVIDATKPSSDAVQEIKRKFGDDVTGVDAAIIATDAIPSYQFGTDILRKHGTLIVVGQPSEPIPLKFVDVIFKDITVKGSLLGESAQAEELAKLMVKHGVEFTVRTFKLEDLNKAVDASHDATGKAVIVFD